MEYQEVTESLDSLPETSIRVSLPEIREGPSDVGEYLMTVRIQASQGEARTVDVTLVGLYRLPADDDRQESLGMLAYNGPAILFSSARGVIESVTGMSGYGRMHVPSVNIAELIDR